MQIRYNIQAMTANNQLKVNDKKLSESIGRLSSGLKINSAKDNPSGLAMARRMNKQITSMGVANDSTKDGINIIKTTDGVLSEIHDVLQRMNELAVKAANGTMTTVDREAIQDEIIQLKEEIDRIGQSTDFNGQHLLDGTFDLRGYATMGTDTQMAGTGATNINVKVSSYSEEVGVGYANITGLDVEYNAENKMITWIGAPKLEGYDELTKTAYTIEGKENISFSGDVITFRDNQGRRIQVQIRENYNSDTHLEFTGRGAMTIQTGANEGQVLDVRIPALTLSNLGIYATDVTKGVIQGEDKTTPKKLDGQGASQKAITEIKNALQYVSEMRSRLGAYQNRLEHTESNLDLTSGNLTASYSTLMDVDMAEEMTEYSTVNVLAQAGVSILAQANERPSQALQLLQ